MTPLRYCANKATENEPTEYVSTGLYIHVPSMLIHPLLPLDFLRERDSIVGGKLVNRPTGVSIATSWFISASPWSASRSSLLAWDVYQESQRVKRGLRIFSIRMKRVIEAFLEVCSKSHASSMILSMQI